MRRGTKRISRRTQDTMLSSGNPLSSMIWSSMRRTESFCTKRRKCYRCPLLLQARIMFDLFSSDFKTILKGSSFLGLRSSFYTYPFFHDIIKNLLISQGKQDLPINEDNITSFFLKLPTLSSIAFNNKTKIVEEISI